MESETIKIIFLSVGPILGFLIGYLLGERKVKQYQEFIKDLKGGKK